ncbi:hypothetical protein Poli38472_005260 [Pythium oligandrum]|uniref:Uncharacterized protein n=1 Tax=Pythium oligandrum TaxID=41045 RepID=A0A8K1FKB0_PYTOL|nr:hypothetical protein Poli38472_005260 [Pythium oligandrum]|eukprot:TMW62642.1 hypothetical protein Poli38472_005260 [Pythium oligandrum]
MRSTGFAVAIACALLQLVASQDAEPEMLGMAVPAIVAGDNLRKADDANAEAASLEAEEQQIRGCRPGGWNWPRCRNQCRPGGWNWPRCRRDCRPGGWDWPRCRQF